MDPDEFGGTLVRISGLDEAAALSPDTEGVFVSAPSEALFATLAARLPGLRHIITDGNTGGVTDAAVAHLAALGSLETLDLEWSAITDASLAVLAGLPALQWVDLGSVAAVTAEGLNALRAARPNLEIET
ncbi:hypothetical protein FHS01_005693 [Longimicrobium terrae]|uniref:Leucine-rich repeat domain-containing protein n=2 Tax=Longimicrobium terrae TaxID=1639882 RepID=A0A841H7V6_9BACT|nr:hypothetical protein [Longimicrobium terrae]MBB4639615.1 hypothetical protein [Longimicrobium terrae]MBB6073982.1 hypothetical protein [Longimicrobium terrae]